MSAVVEALACTHMNRRSDRRVLKLILQWLAAGVMEDGMVR